MKAPVYQSQQIKAIRTTSQYFQLHNDLHLLLVVAFLPLTANLLHSQDLGPKDSYLLPPLLLFLGSLLELRLGLALLSFLRGTVNYPCIMDASFFLFFYMSSVIVATFRNSMLFLSEWIT